MTPNQKDYYFDIALNTKNSGEALSAFNKLIESNMLTKEGAETLRQNASSKKVSNLAAKFLEAPRVKTERIVSIISALIIVAILIALGYYYFPEKWSFQKPTPENTVSEKIDTIELPQTRQTKEETEEQYLIDSRNEAYDVGRNFFGTSKFGVTEEFGINGEKFYVTAACALDTNLSKSLVVNIVIHQRGCENRIFARGIKITQVSDSSKHEFEGKWNDNRNRYPEGEFKMTFVNEDTINIIFFRTSRIHEDSLIGTATLFKVEEGC